MPNEDLMIINEPLKDEKMKENENFKVDKLEFTKLDSDRTIGVRFCLKLELVDNR